MADIQELQWQVGNLTEALEAVTTTSADHGAAVDTMWITICGMLVFFMQCGFAMLEAGSVRAKNAVNILFKNLLDCSVGAVMFWLLGYGFAYGESAGGFIGTTNFGLAAEPDYSGYHNWFFQFAFAATAATIVSGSVAERTKFTAYLIYSAVITTFIYPIVVHWGWSGSGWTEFGDDTRFNDFAGSGIVHMVGGFSGLMGAIVVGPRSDRFEKLPNGKYGEPKEIPAHNLSLCSLGVCILWFGWYGFNPGSTLGMTGGAHTSAALVATTTTIAAAAGCLVCTVLSKVLEKHFDFVKALNGVLAGLVSITAPCYVVSPTGAFFIGLIGGAIYYGTSNLLVKLKIDDPLDACPIHGFAGLWGVLSVGIFGTEALGGAGDVAFGPQLIGGLAILAWSVGTSGLMFFAIDKTIGMRVDASIEEQGLDTSEHGGKAYDSIELGVQKAAA